jgi:malate dehydrogenase (oxaloacetate-decarboxylating)
MILECLVPQYAAVVATGRSDFPNQINNVLAFPGVFQYPAAADVRDGRRWSTARIASITTTVMAQA